MYGAVPCLASNGFTFDTLVLIVFYDDQLSYGMVWRETRPRDHPWFGIY